MPEVDKRTKEYKDSIKETDFSKAENNPNWRLCSECGKELPPGDDGLPAVHKYPTPCHECVWRNK